MENAIQYLRLDDEIKWWPIFKKIMPKSHFFPQQLADTQQVAELFETSTPPSNPDQTNMPCSNFHANSCTVASFERVIHCFPVFWKSYLIIHLIPLLLFKRKQLIQRKTRRKALVKFLKGYGRSLLFVSSYNFFAKRAFCLAPN